MNGLVYGILGFLALVGVLYMAMITYHNMYGPFFGKDRMTCADCKAKGGDCVHDKEGKFASCKTYPHKNPHHGSETFVAQPGLDAYYTFYGVPNFPL